MSKFLFILGSLKVIKIFIPIKITDILTVFMIYVLPNLSGNFFEICIILSDISIFKHSLSEPGFVCEARQALEQPLISVWFGVNPGFTAVTTHT